MKNTFVKVLSFMMALTMIVGAFSAITVSAAECAHEGGKYVKTVEATCQSAGYEQWHCDDCGADYMKNYQPKSNLKHKLETVPASDPTCDKPGYNEHQVCTVEGCTYVDPNRRETAPALGHKEVTVKHAANCTEAERWVTTCTTCGKTLKTEAVIGGEAAKGHTNKYVVEVEPTTCTDGKVSVKCGVCNVVIAETVTLAAKHNFVVVPNHTYPCCEYKVKANKPAGTLPKVCSLCGKVDANTEKKTSVAHDYATPVTGTGTDGVLALADMNAEIEKLGFKVGDATSATADCKKAGWVLGTCACGAYGKKPVAKSAHAAADLTTEYQLREGGVKKQAWTPANFQASMDTLIAEKSCVAEIVYITYCPSCDYVKSTDVIAAAKADHNWQTKEVQKMSCKDNQVGYSEISCKDCAHAAKTTTNIVYVTHNWNAWTTATGATCADALTDAATGTLYLPQYRTCKVAGCTASESSVGLTNAKIITSKSHTYAGGKTHVVAATCAAGGATYKVCDDCGDKTTAKVANSDTPVNANNHCDACKAASREAAVAAGTLQATAATCTTTGYEKYRAICETEDFVFIEVVIPAKGHKMPAGTEADPYVDVVVGTGANQRTVQGKKVEPTCTTVGYEARPVCTVCGHTDVAQKEIAKNPANHSGTYNVVGEAVAANCQTRAYEWRNYTCCGLLKVYTSTELGDHSYEMSGYKAATCTEDGYHSHMWCKVCHAPKAGDLRIADCTCDKGTAHINLNLKGEFVIAKTNHDFSKTTATYKIAEKPETCDESGWAAYIKCANAECANNGDKYAKVGSAVVVYTSTDDFVNPKTTTDTADDKYQEFYDAIYIAPHLDTKVVSVSVDKVSAPTCTDDGVVSGTYCAKCKKYTVDQTIKYWDKTTQDFATKEVKEGDALVKVDKLGHSLAPVTVNGGSAADFDCTDPTYIVKMCSRCTHGEAGEFSVGKSAHTWGAYVTLNFANPDDRALAAKLGISINPCEDGVYKVRKCSNTGCTVYDAPVKDKAAGKHEVVKSGTTYTIDLSCAAISTWIGETCKNCGITVTADHTQHKEMVLTNAGVDNACTTDIYYIHKCAVCDKNLRVDTDPAEFTEKLGHKEYADKDAAVADTAQVEYVKSYTPATDTAAGSLVYVCAKCGEDVTVVYNVKKAVNTTPVVDSALVAAGSAFKVTVKVSATDVIFNQLLITVNVPVPVADVKVVYDFGDVSVHADVVAGNKVYLYTENGVDGNPEFATLNADDEAVIELTIVAPDFIVGDVFIQTTAISAVTSFDEDGNDVVIDFVDNGENAVVKFANTGDLNGDGIVGIKDVQKIIDLVANGSTDAIADVDRDGDVDAFDVAALRKFIKNACTVTAYLDMVNENVDKAIADATYGLGMTPAEIADFKTFIKNFFDSADYTVYLEGCVFYGAEDLYEFIVNILENHLSI